MRGIVPRLLYFNGRCKEGRNLQATTWSIQQKYCSHVGALHRVHTCQLVRCGNTQSKVSDTTAYKLHLDYFVQEEHMYKIKGDYTTT